MSGDVFLLNLFGMCNAYSVVRTSPRISLPNYFNQEMVMGERATEE